jgi:ABC-2 type transport system ATP-binding protein
MYAIETRELAKSFTVKQPRPSGRAWFGSLLRPRDLGEVSAVRGVSLAIAPGERVAFIGPNGAGKSTTLKMLTGILTPTSGHAEIAGFVPWLDRQRLAQRIGILFGQRSQLWHHLPVGDSFDLLAKIYRLDRAVYAERRGRLAAVFGIGEFLSRPVSQLSLGQRLRCEIAASLLHAPKVLLLDEPTIGLDVTAKAALRDHLNALSREEGLTILLTSHDTGDIEEICERAMVIDKGAVLLDRPVAALRRQFLQHRSVTVVAEDERPALDLPGVTVSAREPHKLTLAVDTEATTIERVVSAALSTLLIRDLMIENPPLDDVIRAIYRSAEAAS